MSFTDDLTTMIGTGRGNAWLQFEEMEVYVRVGKKIIGEEFVPCIQLANLQTPVKHQHKGTFDRLLREIRTVTIMPVYVEQILNLAFFEALLRRHFTPAREYDGVIYDLVLIGET